MGLMRIEEESKSFNKHGYAKMLRGSLNKDLNLSKNAKEREQK